MRVAEYNISLCSHTVSCSSGLIMNAPPPVPYILTQQFKAGLENDVAYATHMAGRRTSLKALAAGTASSINRRSNGMRASDGFSDQQGRVSGGGAGSAGGDASILAMASSIR